MNKIFIDCEFDGFGGPLISMGLVNSNGKEFYEVVDHGPIKDSWVMENVIPILHKESVPYDVFQERLYRWLKPQCPFTLIADWPDDIRYFLESIMTGPGRMMDFSSLHFEVHRRWLHTKESVILHNALSDARAIMQCYLDNEQARGAS